MFKVVIDRHSAKIKKVEFIKDESFKGKYPSIDVDIYFKLKRISLGLLFVIMCEAIMLYFKSDGFLLFLFAMTILLSILIIVSMLIDSDLDCKYDVRCHDNEYGNSDVLRFYASNVRNSVFYVGLTYDEITVIMPTKYSNNEVLKYTNYSGTQDFVSVFDEIGAVNFNESFHKSVSEVRDNFKYFDNYLAISYQIDAMVEAISRCVKPLCYIVKEEK